MGIRTMRGCRHHVEHPTLAQYVKAGPGDMVNLLRSDEEITQLLVAAYHAGSEPV